MRNKERPDKKIIKKQKDWASPNYVGQIRSNLNFEVNFEAKMAENAKIEKNQESIFDDLYGKSAGHIGLKFCTVSFLTRIYSFVFIRFFVGGCLENNTKN